MNLPANVKINDSSIYVPDNVQLSDPIRIKSPVTIYLGKHAELKIIHECQSEKQNSSVMQIELAEHAKLHYIKLQNEHAAVQHHIEYSVTQAAHSQLRSQSYHLGSEIARENWMIALQGEHADVACHGIAIACDKQQMHVHLIIQHAAPHCRSEQAFKAIATDTAKALFSGKVIVAKTGAGAQAHQHSQNLLLSTSAEIGTRPELEVYTDDVSASHGATVGQLDKDALFFLRARGIPLAQAEQILLQAFVETNLQNLPNDIQTWLAPFVSEKLSAVRQYE